MGQNEGGFIECCFMPLFLTVSPASWMYGWKAPAKQSENRIFAWLHLFLRMWCTHVCIYWCTSKRIAPGSSSGFYISFDTAEQSSFPWTSESSPVAQDVKHPSRFYRVAGVYYECIDFESEFRQALMFLTLPHGRAREEKAQQVPGHIHLNPNMH